MAPLSADSSDDLVRLVYVSRRGDGASERDIMDMVRDKQGDNLGIGVTSCLWIGRSRFFQLIEGPREVVQSLFRRIELDPRHLQVRRLSLVRISVRGFFTRGIVSVPEGRDPDLDEIVNRFADVALSTPEMPEEPEVLRQILRRLQALT